MNTFQSYNPVTGEVAGAYQIAGATDVACAVERARERAGAWAALSAGTRRVALGRLRRGLAGDADAIAKVVTREIGKPMQEALGADVLSPIQALAWLERAAPGVLRTRRVAGSRGARLEAQPYGVVGVIGTWNYPIFLNVTPIAWALAAGNAVVWKPSELATASALVLAGHFERAGLPVVTVTGDGTTGQALCRAGVDKLAFTGGVGTGRAILAELARTGVPSVMELSGNDALIVCADADVRMAARSAVWARVTNAGQSCIAPQRVYVAREVYDRFLLEARRELQTLRVGTDYAPMRTDRLREQAHALVQDAVSRGARLLAGGRSVADLPGFYYEPTLLADCGDDLPVMRQDFFGPILAVCPVQDEAEAVQCANDSDMALAASVWTRNGRRGREIAAQLRVGLVAVNDVLLDGANPALPFGGFRASGFGKQRGAAGLEEFVQWKVIAPHGMGGARRHLFPYAAETPAILRALVRLQAAQGWGGKLAAFRELGNAARQWQATRKRAGGGAESTGTGDQDA